MKVSLFLQKRFLGIDIGTSAIKVVELSSFAGRKRLENYGEIAASAMYQKPFRTFEKSTLLLSSKDIARAIKAIIEEAKMKSRGCIFSIPDFATFFTNIELPPMTDEEIPEAVKVEARRHVPLPLGEVELGWQLLTKRTKNKSEEKLKILLVAAPNEIINQYRSIAASLNLELFALEAEVFGLVRSLINDDANKVVGIVEVGDRTTTCSMVEKKVLKSSYSFDISGDDLTERIAKSLSIDYQKANDLKKQYGILSLEASPEGKDIKEILVPLIDIIVREIDKAFKNFYWKEKKEIAKIILGGGSSLLPGLKEYFQDYFKKEVEIANPFSKIFFPPILDKTLKEMGPAYAIAVGMALRGLE